MGEEKMRVHEKEKMCVECGCTIEESHESFLYECERCMNERD